MTAARHKAVVEHATRRRLARLTAPALAATVVTGTIVGISVAAIDTEPPAVAATQISQRIIVNPAERLEDRQQSVSRAAERVTLVERPEPVGFRFATTALNLRTEPSDKAKVVDVLDFASRLPVTGVTKKGFAEVVRDGKAYWVSAEFLAKEKPKPEKVEEVEESADSGGLTVGACTAAPPSGVVSGAMAVFEAVCARFPSVTTYGGYRGDGEHSDGRAVDIMVSGDLGWQIAEYLRANAGTFGLYDIIYSQKIWTQERSSEGWRYMSDRGSTTANHYDHVHVKVY